MQKTLFLSLILLCTLTVALQAAPPSFIEVNITTNPSGVFFSVDGSGSRYGPTPTKYKFRKGREYKLTFFHDGKTTDYTFTANSSSIYVSLGGGGNEEPEEATVKVISNVNGASVYISGTYRGTTPLSLNLENGSYDLSVTKSGYTTYSTRFKVRGENLTLNADISPLMKKLEVKSNVGNADVYIDGNYQGRTQLTVDLEPGTHLVEVKKDGYYNFSTQVTMTSNRDESIYAMLQPIEKISLEVPKGAKVWVDGERQQIAWGNESTKVITIYPSAQTAGTFHKVVIEFYTMTLVREIMVNPDNIDKVYKVDLILQ